MAALEPQPMTHSKSAQAKCFVSQKLRNQSMDHMRQQVRNHG